MRTKPIPAVMQMVLDFLTVDALMPLFFRGVTVRLQKP